MQCKHERLIILKISSKSWTWNCDVSLRRLCTGSTAEDSVAVLARHSARFDVLHVQFDPVSGKHLAVAGLRTLQVTSAQSQSTQPCSCADAMSSVHYRLMVLKVHGADDSAQLHGCRVTQL